MFEAGPLITVATSFHMRSLQLGYQGTFLQKQPGRTNLMRRRRFGDAVKDGNKRQLGESLDHRAEIGMLDLYTTSVYVIQCSNSGQLLLAKAVAD